VGETALRKTFLDYVIARRCSSVEAIPCARRLLRKVRSHIVDCGYWKSEDALKLRQKCEEVGRLLGGMMAKSDMFCGDGSHTLRESPAEYFVEEQ